MKLRNILENIVVDDTKKNVQKELRRIASDCGLVAQLNMPRETSGGTVYTVGLKPKSSNLEKWTAVDTFNGHVGYGMNESYYDAVFKFWLTVFDMFKDRIDIMIHNYDNNTRGWKKVPSVVKISDSWFKDQRNSLAATSFRISKN